MSGIIPIEKTETLILGDQENSRLVIKIIFKNNILDNVILMSVNGTRLRDLTALNTVWAFSGRDEIVSTIELLGRAKIMLEGGKYNV